MTLLVDIGNVLVTFCYHSFVQKMAPGSDYSVLDDVLALRDRFETGEMGVSDFTQKAKRILNFDGEDQTFQDAWCQIFSPVPEMERLVPRWKINGHQLILFSNINPLHHPFCFRKFPHLFAYFDDAILSYQVGGMKPGPAMYDHAIEKLQIDPADTLYLDDLSDNLETGRKYGFDTLQIDWQKPAEMLKAFNSYGLA